MHFLWECACCLSTPNLYAHINHAFARAVTAFHVQPCQDYCGPWRVCVCGGGSGALSELNYWVQVLCSLCSVEYACKKKKQGDRQIKPWCSTFTEYKCVQGQHPTFGCSHVACMADKWLLKGEETDVATKQGEMRSEWMQTAKKCSPANYMIDAEVAERGQVYMTYKRLQSWE